MLDAKRVDEFITLAGDWNPYYLAACDQTELNGGQTTIYNDSLLQYQR